MAIIIIIISSSSSSIIVSIVIITTPGARHRHKGTRALVPDLQALA